jgi:tRNA(adenine34) deaminase
MKLALEQAQKAYDRDEVPVGAVIIKDGQVIASGCNQVIKASDPSAHAEMIAIRDAARNFGSEFLVGCDLYVTLEPCPMCAFAIALARIDRVYFGAYDPKMGGVESGPRIFNSSSCHHKPEVYGGLKEEECGALLKKFFASKREK